MVISENFIYVPECDERTQPNKNNNTNNNITTYVRYIIQVLIEVCSYKNVILCDICVFIIIIIERFIDSVENDGSLYASS